MLLFESYICHTVNEESDVAIDLSREVIEIYFKPLLDRYIAKDTFGHISGLLKSD